MTFWPHHFFADVRSHVWLTVGAALLGVAIAGAIKWRTIRDLWRARDDGE